MSKGMLGITQDSPKQMVAITTQRLLASDSTKDIVHMGKNAGLNTNVHIASPTITPTTNVEENPLGETQMMVIGPIALFGGSSSHSHGKSKKKREKSPEKS